jgi:hypothetical protein
MLKVEDLTTVTVRDFLHENKVIQTLGCCGYVSAAANSLHEGASKLRLRAEREQP